jgi:nucleoside-diphosphate-sugar epimerase
MQATNVAGTRHLLDGLDRVGRPAGLVLASTVAVYGLTSGTLVTEDADRLATDPYGSTRREVEDLVTSWGDANGVRVTVIRLPLVAGAGAPGQLGAMVRAMARGRYLGVGDGSARRSMVLASEVASVLPRALSVGGTYHLTDGHHPSFKELEAALAAALGRRAPRHLPTPVARVAGALGDLWSRTSGLPSPVRRDTVGKMTSTLTFDDARARAALGWSPSRVVDHAAELVR